MRVEKQNGGRSCIRGTIVNRYAYWAVLFGVCHAIGCAELDLCPDEHHCYRVGEVEHKTEYVGSGQLNGVSRQENDIEPSH